jgi:hypothetical protein
VVWVWVWVWVYNSFIKLEQHLRSLQQQQQQQQQQQLLLLLPNTILCRRVLVCVFVVCV